LTLQGGSVIARVDNSLTQWFDQSGYNRTINAVGTSPTLTDTEIRFTASSSNYLINNTTSFGIETAFSVFLVIRNNSHVNNSGILSLIPSQSSPNNRDWASASGRSITQSNSSTNLRLLAHAQFSSSNGFTNPLNIDSPSSALGNYYLLSIIQGGGIGSLQINNNVVVQDTYDGSPISPAGLVLGARFDAGINGFGNFDVKELIIFPTDKSSERASIVAEINRFYGIF
jgi:hypothetical protein